MRTQVPDKLLAIVSEIDTLGTANLTRLTVMKKWFEKEGRLPAFGLWVARRSASRKGRAKASALLKEARALLGNTSTREDFLRPVDKLAAADLHERAKNFQQEYEDQRWARVRIIHCWQLLLVEKGLALYTRQKRTPSDGYQLVTDYCQNYDPKYGNTLNGPSRTKIMEIVRFMFTIEAFEEEAESEM